MTDVVILDLDCLIKGGEASIGSENLLFPEQNVLHFAKQHLKARNRVCVITSKCPIEVERILIDFGLLFEGNEKLKIYSPRGDIAPYKSSRCYAPHIYSSRYYAPHNHIDSKKTSILRAYTESISFRKLLVSKDLCEIKRESGEIEEYIDPSTLSYPEETQASKAAKSYLKYDYSIESFDHWYFDFDTLIRGVSQNGATALLPEKPWKPVDSVIKHIQSLIHANKKVAIIDRLKCKLSVGEMGDFLNEVGITSKQLIICNGKHYRYIDSSGEQKVLKINKQWDTEERVLRMNKQWDRIQNIIMSMRLAFAPYSCGRIMYVASNHTQILPVMRSKGIPLMLNGVAMSNDVEWDEEVIMDIYSSGRPYQQEAFNAMMNVEAVDSQRKSKIEGDIHQHIEKRNDLIKAIRSDIDTITPRLESVNRELEASSLKIAELTQRYGFLKKAFERKIKAIVDKDVRDIYMKCKELHTLNHYTLQQSFELLCKNITCCQEEMVLRDENIQLLQRNLAAEKEILLYRLRSIKTSCLEAKEVEYPNASDAIQIVISKPKRYNKFLYGCALLTAGCGMWFYSTEHRLIRYSGATLSVLGTMFIGASRE